MTTWKDVRTTLLAILAGILFAWVLGLFVGCGAGAHPTHPSLLRALEASQNHSHPHDHDHNHPHVHDEYASQDHDHPHSHIDPPEDGRLVCQWVPTHGISECKRAADSFLPWRVVWSKGEVSVRPGQRLVVARDVAGWATAWVDALPSGSTMQVKPSGAMIAGMTCISGEESVPC